MFNLKVTGKSAHVGQPHEGVDAVLAAASITVELQSIVSREVDPLEPAVVAIGVLKAGTRYNIVANEALLEGTIRTFNYETSEKVLKAVERLAEKTAESQRATVTFENYDAAAPLLNVEESAERAVLSAAHIVGEENVLRSLPKSMGADDFVDFLAEAPGVYTRVGTKNLNDASTWYGHHHEKFDIDEAALSIATELHVRYALDYLNE